MSLSPESTTDNIPYLHLYPGAFWHDDAVIIGTRAALLALQKALDLALTKGAAVTEAFVNDGEGYVLAACEASAEEMRGLPVTYTDPVVSVQQHHYFPFPEVITARIGKAFQDAGYSQLNSLPKTLENNHDN